MVSPISIPGFPSVHTRRSAATCDSALASRLDAVEASLAALIASLPSLIATEYAKAFDNVFDASFERFRRGMLSRGAAVGISAPLAIDHHVSPAIEPIQLPRSPICAEGAQSQLIPSAIQAPPLLSSSPLLRALSTSAVKPHSKHPAAAIVSFTKSKTGIHTSMMTSAPSLLHEHPFSDTTKTGPEVVLNLSIILATSEATFPSLLTDYYGAYLKDKFGWVNWYLVGKFVKKNLYAFDLFDEMSKRQNDNMFIQPLVHSIEVLHLDYLAIQLHYFDLNCYLGFEYGSTIALGRVFVRGWAVAANEFIELLCELVVSRLSIIAEQMECLPSLKEGIASLIFASPRCSEISELIALTNVFEKKHGKDFVSEAVDVRPNCGVNRMLIDKLSVRIPMGEVKLKLLKEIAKEYHVEWDTSKSEQELFKPPEELTQGCNFGSTTSMPVHSVQPQSVKTNKPNISSSRRTIGGEKRHMQFVDSASAAKAAVTSANDAMAAAQVAAYWTNRDCNQDIDIVSLKERKEASPLSLTVSLRSKHVGRFQSLDQFMSCEYHISLADNLESEVKSRDEDYSQLFSEVHKFDDGISEFNNMVSANQAMVTQSDVLKLKFAEGSTMSKLWLLNLGGSERQEKTEVQGKSLTESQNINKSLSALGYMISALSRIKALDRLGHVDEENAKAVSLLENVLDLSDSIDDEAMVAGNIFGLVYAQLAEVFSKYSMSFLVSCQNLVPRPWVINDFDAAMVVCVISECEHSGALDHKKCVHTYCKRGGFYTNISVKNALIGMIIGLAMKGKSVGALEMFSQMEASSDVKPTFRGGLSACSHGGFVDKGFHHFGAITEIYKLSPRIEHYRCMGDLLGRANLLNEVEIFIKDTPIEPDVIIWKSLLFAYRTYGNIVLAELVAKRSEVFESKGAFIKLLQDKDLSVRLAACRSLCLPSEDTSFSEREFINLLPICWDLCLKLIKEVQEFDSKKAWEESADECLLWIQLVGALRTATNWEGFHNSILSLEDKANFQGGNIVMNPKCN
ncbi:hypothetical protein ACFX13_015134 [Malus domestica]